MKKLFLIAVMGILLASCANNQTENTTTELTAEQLKQEEANLMETNRKWAKAASPKDFFSFVSKDALMMPPDKPVIKGHEGIGKTLQEFQALPGFKIT